MMRNSGWVGFAGGGVAILVSVAGGCQRPIDRDSPDALHRYLVESVEREIRELPQNQAPIRTAQPEDEITRTLEPRMEELRRIAGPDSYGGMSPPDTHDLTGGESETVEITLEEAISAAVANNLSVQIAQVQPAISEAEVVAAEAAFDAVFFSNVSYTKTDEPTTRPVLNGIPLGTSLTVREMTTFETGIRKPLISGGLFTVSTSLDRLRNKTPGFSLTPDPAYTARIALGIDQPLLRGFGSDVNQAQIRLARNQDRRSIQQLKSALLNTVEATEIAYWDLVGARQSLLIQQRLLERGIETRDILERRRERGDVLQAEIADAIARVQQRRADVIRAIRLVRAASDRLKALVNAPDLTVGSEAMIAPVDFMVEAPLEFDVREAIITAIGNRPEIAEQVIALDDAGIFMTVADNARLPLLNLAARMEYVGLEDDPGSAYGNASEDTFIDYFLSLVFELPIGNRAAEAEYRRTRLQRSAAYLAYRNAVQSVVLEVKSALRDVMANYELIQAARSFRIAQAENMRAFDARDVQEGLTTVRLNIKFQRQEGLAAAEIQEIEALANFSKAIARLYAAMGIGLEKNGIEFVLPEND